MEEAYANEVGFRSAWVFAIPARVILALIARAMAKGSDDGDGERGLAMPDDVTLFSVFNLLRDIRGPKGLGDAQRSELDAAVIHIEQHSFGEKEAERPDLAGIARDWLRRA